MASGEPLELQLQRERVARSQVEAALESTRLQLIEMEYALRKAREEATRGLKDQSVSAREPVKTMAACAPPSAAAKPAPAPEPQSMAAVAHSKPRPRRSTPKPAGASLVEVARAAEAIEKASRVTNESSTMVSPMAGMLPGRAAEPLLSTLDLHSGDNRAIVQDFVQHLQTRLSKMQACYGSGNLTELKWHVNWITLNADAMGFAPLTPPATELEQVLQAQQHERIGMLMDRVIQIGERVAVEPARK